MSSAPGAARPSTPRSDRSKPARVMSRKTKSLVPSLGHQHGRHHGALAAGEAGAEGGAALVVGRGRAEDLVVLGKQRQLDADQWLGGAERAGEDVQPVLAGVGRQADVGDDEPLRGARIPGVAPVVLRLRGQDVDAGLAVGQRLVDREAGGDFLVEVAGDVELALPDRRAELVGDVLDVVAVELAQELVAGQKLGQRAVADPEQLHVGDGHVDRDDRDAAPRIGRQHEAVAVEAHGGAAVLDVDRQHDRARQHFADRGRQAGAERDAVVLAVLETLDADLLAGRLDRLRRLAVDGHEGRVVDAGLDEFLRKLGADARRAGVGIDRVLDDAEALAGLQILVVGAHRGRILQREARLVGLERRAVHVAAIEADGDRREHVGAGRGRAQQLVSVPAGRGGVPLQRRPSRCRRCRRRREARGSGRATACRRRARCRWRSVYLATAVRASPVSSACLAPSTRPVRPTSPATGWSRTAGAVLLRLEHHPGGEEGEFRRRADVGLRR